MKLNIDNAEMEELFCPCGCGITIGQPLELVNGEWVIAPISEARMLELASARHPKTR